MSGYTVMSQQALAPMHTFAMPAMAANCVQLHQAAALMDLTQLPGWHWPKVQVLGGGSNTIFTRDVQWLLQIDLQGLVVESAGEAVLVTVAAGEPWDKFVAWTLSQGYWGLENLSLIPGSVGAAPIQNIGAYGVEVATRIQAVQVFDYTKPQKGLYWLPGASCGFGYRDSYFKQQWAHLVIVQVQFRLDRQFSPCLTYKPLDSLRAQPELTALQLRALVIQLRQARLPDPALVPNVGSFFKNPVITLSHYRDLTRTYACLPSYPVAEQQVKIPAAWLLEQSGFKGQALGCFACYHLQPLVLVHDNQQPQSLIEKTQLLRQFIAQIKTTVQTMFGIDLEIEPVLV